MSDQARFDPAAFYTEHANTYDTLWGDSGRLDALRWFVREVPPNALVLDPACGTGRDLSLASDAVRMVGADVAKGALKRAATRSPLVLCADFTAVPFADAVFAGVFARAALVHASDGEALQALTEWSRVTQPDGVLYTSVKSAARLDDDGFDTMGRWNNLWTPLRLAATAQEAGWVPTMVSVECDAVRDDVSWVTLHAVRAA